MGLNAHTLEGLGKEGGYLPIPVHHKNMLGLWMLEVGNPADEMIPIRVGGEAVEIGNVGVDGNFLAKKLDAFCALHQVAA